MNEFTPLRLELSREARFYPLPDGRHGPGPVIQSPPFRATAGSPVIVGSIPTRGSFFCRPETAEQRGVIYPRPQCPSGQERKRGRA